MIKELERNYQGLQMDNAAKEGFCWPARALYKNLRVTIVYRVDTEEFFTTDSVTLQGVSWSDVFREVLNIEKYHTVANIVQENLLDGSPIL
jgi:hypothetical protein